MKKIELVRRNKRWTQSQLGRLRTVRISPSFISLLEQGRGIPNDDQRDRLACALGIPPEQQLDDVDVGSTVPPVVEEPLDDPERADARANA